MKASGFVRFVLAAGAVVATTLLTSAPAMAGQASNWKVGYYTPSGRALSMASAAAAANGVATFDFTSQTNTALLVTDHGSSPLLGNDQGRTISATFDISGASAFTYFGEGDPINPCPGPANVRLFFESTGGGFAFTNFWWSDTAFAVLSNGTMTISANASPVGWSDWDGKLAEANVDAFNAAASDVTLIGLSFGGGCFFENGVGTVDGAGTFTLDSFSVS